MAVARLQRTGCNPRLERRTAGAEPLVLFSSLALNTKETMSVTFEVASVVLAQDLLNEEKLLVSAERVVNDSQQASIVRAALAIFGKDKINRRAADDKEDDFDPLGHLMKLPGTIEACSNPDADVVIQPGYHPLIAAAHLSFAQHRPLAFTPDMIWVTIIQGLATHVGLNAEKYRALFVPFEGTKKIELRRPQFVSGRAQNDWAGVFSEFSDRIKEDIGADTHKLAVSDFSTTGPLERSVSELALLALTRPYFHLSISSSCGIPSVTLDGTNDDWRNLQDKVKQLRRFADLEWWLDKLDVFAANCVAACAGNADPEFWGRLYKHTEESGGNHINGWLLTLLPYVTTKDGRPMENSLLRCEKSRMLNHTCLPTSMGKVPFIWKFLDHEESYEMLGGLIAVEQDHATLTIRPRLGWAVRPTPDALVVTQGSV